MSTPAVNPFGPYGPQDLCLDTCTHYGFSEEKEGERRVMLLFSSGEYRTRCTVKYDTAEKVERCVAHLEGIPHLRMNPNFDLISIDVEGQYASVEFAFPARSAALAFSQKFALPRLASRKADLDEQGAKFWVKYTCTVEENKTAQIERINSVLNDLKAKLEPVVIDHLLSLADNESFPGKKQPDEPIRSLDEVIKCHREFVWCEAGCYEVSPLSMQSQTLAHFVEPSEFYNWINDPAKQDIAKRAKHVVADAKYGLETRLRSLFDKVKSSVHLRPFAGTLSSVELPLTKEEREERLGAMLWASRPFD